MKTRLDIPGDEVEECWPNLAIDNHHETSEASKKYNCIAWAIGITNERWAPYTGHKWFPGLKKIREFPGDDIEAHKQGFATIGYMECFNGDKEEDFEKIALYVKGRSVEHVAKQITNGHWTSKLGKKYHDIEHYSLHALEGTLYGDAIIFMKRKLKS